MGKTYKDESFGADGKFRNRRRASERRNVTPKRQQSEPVFADSYEESNSFSLKEDLDEKSQLQ